jgi:hypothetical protein
MIALHPHVWCSPECDDSTPPTEHRGEIHRWGLVDDGDPYSGRVSEIDVCTAQTVGQPVQLRLSMGDDSVSLEAYLDGEQAFELASELLAGLTRIRLSIVHGGAR